MKNRVVILRISVSLVLLLAFIVGYFLQEASVKAPLLTLIGGAMVVIALYPQKEWTIEQTIMAVGTGIIVSGAYFWVESAVQDKPAEALVRGMSIGVLLILIVWLISFQVYQIVTQSKSGSQSSDLSDDT